MSLPCIFCPRIDCNKILLGHRQGLRLFLGREGLNDLGKRPEAPNQGVHKPLDLGFIPRRAASAATSPAAGRKYEEQPHPLQDHKRHHASVDLREAVGPALHGGRAIERSGGWAEEPEAHGGRAPCAAARRAGKLQQRLPRRAAHQRPPCFHHRSRGPAGQQGDGARGPARVSGARAEGESPWPGQSCQFLLVTFY
jgi:hypothetical protein